MSKFDLLDVTFNIPVFIDSEDRKTNLRMTVDYLLGNFNTNITICEQGSEQVQEILSGVEYKYIQIPLKDELIWPARQHNTMVLASETPIIVLCDADILADVSQYCEATTLIRDNKADIVLPYSCKNYHSNEGKWGLYEINNLQKEDFKNTGILPSSVPLTGYHRICDNSLGGLMFFNKKIYMRGGMTNENFVSWGCEDYERHHRFTKLGYTVTRLRGYLFHLKHVRKPKSSTGSHPYFRGNKAELKRIKDMDCVQLEQEISKWGWMVHDNC